MKLYTDYPITELGDKEFAEAPIREFQNYLTWSYISQYQTLSESFIRQFQDKVYWDFFYLIFVANSIFFSTFAFKHIHENERVIN